MLSEQGEAGSDVERRQQAVSILLAKEANEQDDVVWFRETYLPEGLLAWKDIKEWIGRRAGEAGKPTRFAEIPLPDDVDIRGDSARVAHVFEPRLELETVPAEVGVPRRVKSLGYGTPDVRGAQTVATVAESTLDCLRRTAERLSQRYQWTPEQATVFILTGITPLHALLRTTRVVSMTLPVVSRIELSVDRSLPRRWQSTIARLADA